MSLSLLKDQRVLITGAGRGIGQAIAWLCYEQGAQVAICARNAAELETTAAKMPDRVRTFTTDVTQPTQVQRMVDAIVKDWGGLDILINNAGRGQANKGTVTDLEAAEFVDILQLNVVAVHTVTQAVVPHLRKNGGQILNISSKAGKQGLPNMSLYGASKFALEGLTATWATELKAQGIRVNSISPGMVDTTGFPKPADKPGVRTAASIADGLWLLLVHSPSITGHYLHADELDLVRDHFLPDTAALKPINEPEFADTLSATNPLMNRQLPAPLILGSASFTRKLILKEMRIPYHIVVRPIDEKGIGDREHDDPAHLVLRLAKAKLEHLVKEIQSGRCDDELKELQLDHTTDLIVLTGDQVVTCNGEILEKPESIEEARSFVSRYGQTPPSTVGSCVLTHLPSGITVSGVDTATIHFKPDTPGSLVDTLVAQNEPVLSCAGGLMVEHPDVQAYVDRIDGTQDSVMGLSKGLVSRLLDELVEKLKQCGESEKS